MTLKIIIDLVDYISRHIVVKSDGVAVSKILKHKAVILKSMYQGKMKSYKCSSNKIKTHNIYDVQVARREDTELTIVIEILI